MPSHSTAAPASFRVTILRAANRFRETGDEQQVEMAEGSHWSFFAQARGLMEGASLRGDLRDTTVLRLGARACLDKEASRLNSLTLGRSELSTFLHQLVVTCDSTKKGTIRLVLRSC